MNLKRGYVWCAAVVAIAVLSAVPAMAEDKSDLAGRVQGWVAAFNSADDAGIAALYTEDSKRMPYQAETVNGRDGIETFLGATREASGAVKVELAVTGAESQGNLAWGSGTYKLMDKDGAVLQSGKWLNVSKKVAGTWLIHRDIWNTDKPE